MIKLADPNPNQNPDRNSNQNPIRGLTQPLDDFFPLGHVVWAAMSKIGQKQFKPDMVADGSTHVVDLTIKGLIDGQPYHQKIASVVGFGHEIEKSSSVTPQVPELVAYILSKLNSATRERILTDIPVEFAENENLLPTPNPELVKHAKQMLKQLRQTKTVTARGPVRCEYSLTSDSDN